MSLTASIEFTRLLALHNLLVAARNGLAEAHDELLRLRDEEMITVRQVPDGRLVSALGDEIAEIAGLMQKVAHPGGETKG